MEEQAPFLDVVARGPLLTILERMVRAKPPEIAAIGLIIDCAEDGAVFAEDRGEPALAEAYRRTATTARQALRLLQEAEPTPTTSALAHARGLVRHTGLTSRHVDEMRGKVAADPLHRLFGLLRAATSLEEGHSA